MRWGNSQPQTRTSVGERDTAWDRLANRVAVLSRVALARQCRVSTENNIPLSGLFGYPKNKQTNKKSKEQDNQNVSVPTRICFFTSCILNSGFGERKRERKKNVIHNSDFRRGWVILKSDFPQESKISLIPIFSEKGKYP